MDDRDQAILRRLMVEGRASWAEISEEIGLSPPAVAERVRKLEERGVILGYAARIDPRSVDAGTLAFIAVRTTGPRAHRAITEWAEETPEVQECHIVSGKQDYLLKVRCRNPTELGSFLREELRALDGVVSTQSTIALGTSKETTALGLADKPPRP